ncbi:MAG: pentapeptide repeat-containing protein [Cyanobacteria bacterium SBC]|nr:pentapeptide repeat-containing protein [Cyanobacteria bacterium SBC]
MAATLQQLWKTLNTPIGELTQEGAQVSIDSAQAVLKLADTIQKNSTKAEIAPLANQISTLLTVLNLPMVKVIGASLPLVNIATTLLSIYVESQKERNKPSLAVCVSVVSQGAYLTSFRNFLKTDEVLQNKFNDQPAFEAVREKIKQLGDLELDEEEAKKVVVCFHSSKLAEAFGEVLKVRLVEAGLSEEEAKILTQRVAWDTPRYLSQAWNESDEAVNYWGRSSLGEWRKELEKYQSIERYLEERIVQLPKDKVFNEEFTFQDIYISLKAQFLDENGDFKKCDVNPFILEDWAKNTLLDPDKAKQVMFVQAGPGRGKSVFCRMFADWVRRNLYPIWTPIVIRLRDITAFEQSFENTLQAAVNRDFTKNDNGWLTDRNRQFLFLLDGFDELRMEGRSGGGIERFIIQVGRFQKECKDNSSEMGHRIIITGRQLALQGISYLPSNLDRIEILPLDDELQQQWFCKWEELVGSEKSASFQDFLRAENCPNTLKDELSREPLLLYLLGAMHRDGDIDLEDLEGISGIQSKIKIYEKSLNWVLNKQRKKDVQKEIVRLKNEDFRCVLKEAGLSVIQSGGEYAKIDAIKARLEKNKPHIVDEIQKVQESQNDDVLKNALAAFYLKPAGNQGGGVEFFHKSFSEFLCAKRMCESLEDWTQLHYRGRGYELNDEKLAEEIYDLFGYGGLTPEIVEYLMGMLTTRENFRPVKLFERLEQFYEHWCEGKFIDAPPDTNYPQKTVRCLQEQRPDESERLGLRQIDIYVGLNIMILLLDLHRYGKKVNNLKENLYFYPCGTLLKNSRPQHPFRLFQIIGYSCVIRPAGFTRIVGQFLRGVDIRGADLRGADLSDADLSDADLRDADLSDAVLRGADLSDADLRGTDLSDADLRGAVLSKAILSNVCNRGAGADLSDADLSRADLSSAVLKNADLSGAVLKNAVLKNAVLSKAILSSADLRGAVLNGAVLNGADLSGASFRSADLSGADLRGAVLSNDVFGDIRWDKYTQWQGVRGLKTARNVPEALKKQLNLD